MDSMIECVLKNAIIMREDLFGKNSAFVSFVRQDLNFDPEGLQSSIHLGRLVYRQCDSSTEHNKDLLLKVTPSSLMMKEFSTLQFFKEVFFYTRILPFFKTSNPKIGQLFPQYYNSLLQYNVDCDEMVIVFENLRINGYLPSEKKSFLDYDHLRLMMRKLGEFHAYSYRAREEAPDKFHAMILSNVETSMTVLKQSPSAFLSQLFKRGFEPLTTDPRYKSKIDNLRELLTNCDDVFRNCLTGNERNCTHVLCHADFVRSNVLFAYKDGKPIDLKIVDLGSWRFASPAVDLALVLYVNADQEMREKNWDALIEEYYTAVRDTFPQTKVPSKDSILKEFKTKVIIPYVVGLVFFPYLIPCDYDDVPGPADILPEEYQKACFNKIPSDLLEKFYREGGGQRSTTALTNILKDIVDRGFV